MTTMTRQLGKSGIQVSAMGLGCWAIGGPFWAGEQPLGWSAVDDAESLRAIEQALDLGVNFFDTADVYGTGHSEKILAKALANKRDQLVIATKFGNVFDSETRQLVGQEKSAAYIRQACEASLKRLQTDYIDLYQLHLSDLPIVEAEVVFETLESLCTDGLIRAYGWSTDDPALAQAFANNTNYVAIQHDLNVFRDAQAILDVCDASNLASINRSPLAMGILTGKFTPQSKLPDDDVRGKAPAWLTFFEDGRPTPEWLTKLESIREILTSGGRTLTQGALAWIWAWHPRTIPIPGFKTLKQVKENAGAMQFGSLPAESLAEIDKLLT
ncbi:MAG: aldo/keto reductase [Chloroflexota bacterium]